MYIFQKKKMKYYHYKIKEKINVKRPYKKKIKISPIGRKYVEVSKKIKR